MSRNEIDQSTRHRILRSVQDRLTVEVPAPTQGTLPKKASRRRIARKRRKRARPSGQSLRAVAVAKLILLALFIVVGAATIIWLRTLAEAFGINWIGE